MLLLMLLAVGKLGFAEPKLVVRLPKKVFSANESILLNITFQLGDGCWVINPNVTSLTFRIIICDEQGHEVPDIPQYVMYRLPGCNLAVFCDVDELTTSISLDGSRRDMYGPYYELNPGRYRLRVVYDASIIFEVWRDDEDHYCWDKIFHRGFVRQLQSNVLEFEVTYSPLSPGNSPSAGSVDGEASRK